MKKSILILFVALFASFQIFAQGPGDPPTCTGGPGNPSPGVDYVYEVEIPATPGYNGDGTFHWYVTQDVNLITGAHEINGAGEIIASGYYDNPANLLNTINITWTSAALATGLPYYLVINYNETNTSGTLDCNGNNMKVYRIMPQNTFWLAMDLIGIGEYCVANVSSAIITEGTDPCVTYLYGQNTMEVLVTASGYTGDFDPQLQISGFLGDQDVVSATWAAALPSTATGTFSGTLAGGVWTSTGSDNPMPSLAAGQAITITIVFVNNTYETLADQTFAVAIDGSYTSGSETYEDLSDENGLCTPGDPFEDFVNQVIKARPTVSPVTPADFVEPCD